MTRFSPRSERALSGVHPDLVAVCRRALTLLWIAHRGDMSIIEGRRSFARQIILRAQGKSKTLRSLHLTGHAVDIYPYPLEEAPHTWDPSRPPWQHIVTAMRRAAEDLGVRDLEWGMELWGWDAPHWQLGRAVSPERDSRPGPPTRRR